jgi:hypothetical protein
MVRLWRVTAPGASEVTLTADVSGFIAPAGPAFAEFRLTVTGLTAPAAERAPADPEISEGVSDARSAPAAPTRPAAVPRAADTFGIFGFRFSASDGASVATLVFSVVGPPALDTLVLRFALLVAGLTLAAALVRGVFGLFTAAELLSDFAETLVALDREAAEEVAVRTFVLRSTLVVSVGVSVRSVVTFRSVGAEVRFVSVRAATVRFSSVRFTTVSFGGGVAVFRLIGGGVAGGGVATTGTGVGIVTLRSGFGVGGGVAGGVSVIGFGVAGGGVGTIFRCGGGVGSGVAARGGVGSGVGVAAGVGDGSWITRFTDLSILGSSAGLVMVILFAITLAP